MTDINSQITTIPIMEEVEAISKRTVETGHVRVRTVVEESTRDILLNLTREDIEIERRTVDREVNSAPAPYHEGEALIIPISEERPVIEKRLFVVEELVVRRIARTGDVHVPATLRKMRAVVERDDEDG